MRWLAPEFGPILPNGIMSESSKTETPSLAELRLEIDGIDAAMHRLLMERGEIISRLIEVKRTQESGSAFRPAREAEMMRRLVERHRGILPLDTAESIWRVIIATFTFVQSPYAIHADLSSGDVAIRDSARFHFGFTVPFVTHPDAASVVTAVAAARGDLGLVPVTTRAGVGPWWSALEGDDRPKIIARLPFVERVNHPAGLPVFVVARPTPDAMVKEVEVWSIRVAGWGPLAARRLVPLAEVVVSPDSALDGAALLLSVGSAGGLAKVMDVLLEAGASVRSAALVGSHATRYTVQAEEARPIGAGQ